MFKSLKPGPQYPIEHLPAMIERKKHALSCLQNRTLARPEHIQNDVCAICCEQLTEGNILSHAGCNHLMHFACIGEWFMLNQSCPVCRHAFVPQVSDNPCFVCSTMNRPTGQGPYIQMRCCTGVLHRQHLASFFRPVEGAVCIVCSTRLTEDVGQWYISHGGA